MPDQSSAQADHAKDVDALCEAASNELEAGKLAQAHELLVRACRLAPANARAHYLLALYYSDTAQPARAIPALEESIRLDPTNAKAHNNHGSLLQTLGACTKQKPHFDARWPTTRSSPSPTSISVICSSAVA